MAGGKKSSRSRDSKPQRHRPRIRTAAQPKAPEAQPEPAGRGRPTLYTEELALNICCRISGGEPLTRIVKDDGMPHLVTVYRWLQKEEHEDFRKLYAQARADQADTLAYEIMEISDKPPRRNRKGVDNGAVQHQRLRVEARKWIASKLKPRAYGERVDQYLMGADGGPITHMVTNRNALRDQIMASDDTRREGSSASASQHIAMPDAPV